MTALAQGIVNTAGNGEYLATLGKSRASGNQGTALDGSFHHNGAQTQPADHPIALGELGRQWRCTGGKLRDQSTTGRHDLASQYRIAGRVNAIRTTTKHRNGTSAADRPPMRRRIDPQSQTTDDHETTASKIPGKTATVVQPVR